MARRVHDTTLDRHGPIGLPDDMSDHHQEAAKLTTAGIERWLNQLAATPDRLRTRVGQPQNYAPLDTDEAKRRRRASANTTWVVLRAALNRAWRQGALPEDKAWREYRRSEA
jgi:hypothetical protein